MPRCGSTTRALAARRDRRGRVHHRRVHESPDRAWRAFHVNWLFFATLSQAGVMFVAVQRITTARWSRAVIRFIEGYVAFLPVAFVLLLLILLGGDAHLPVDARGACAESRRSGSI